MLRLRKCEWNGRACGDGIGVVLGEVEEGGGWFRVFDPCHTSSGRAEDGADKSNRSADIGISHANSIEIVRCSTCLAHPTFSTISSVNDDSIRSNRYAVVGIGERIP